MGKHALLAAPSKGDPPPHKRTNVKETPPLLVRLSFMVVFRCRRDLSSFLLSLIFSISTRASHVFFILIFLFLSKSHVFLPTHSFISSIT